MNHTILAVACRLLGAGAVALTMGQAAVISQNPPTPEVVEEVIEAPVEVPVEPEPTPEPEPEPTPAPTPVVEPAPAPVAPELDLSVLPDWLEPETKIEIAWTRATGIHTISDYISYFSGVCPSKQDTPSALKPYWSKLAALGLDSPYPSWQHYTETAWNEYHQGRTHGTEYGYIALRHLDGGLQSPNAHMPMSMYINWDTWTFFWDSTWVENRGQQNHPSITDAERAQWDRMAAQMTSYLRQIERDYQAKCPGE